MDKNGGDNVKISKDLKTVTTTQTELARALGITQQRVSQLVKDGVVIRDKNGAVILIESLNNFYKLQKESTDKEKVSLEAERALHERAKRELTELKLKEVKNELHSTNDIMLLVGGLVANFKRKMLGIPYKFSNRLEGKKADDINEMLTKEIHDSLIELSELDPSKLINNDDNTE